MNKIECLAASELIKNTICIMARFEVRLACGMWVRCNNTKEARESLAAKFLKGPRRQINSANLLNRRLWK